MLGYHMITVNVCSGEAAVVSQKLVYGHEWTKFVLRDT
jgi:hypothetical protein